MKLVMKFPSRSNFFQEFCYSKEEKQLQEGGVSHHPATCLALFPWLPGELQKRPGSEVTNCHLSCNPKTKRNTGSDFRDQDIDLPCGEMGGRYNCFLQDIGNLHRLKALCNHFSTHWKDRDSYSKYQEMPSRSEGERSIPGST